MPARFWCQRNLDADPRRLFLAAKCSQEIDGLCFPALGWGQGHHYCMMRRHRNVMRYKFRSDSTTILYGLRMPSILRSSFADPCFRRASSLKRRTDCQMAKPTLGTPPVISDCPERHSTLLYGHEMAARAERKRSVRVIEVPGSCQLLIQSLGMIKNQLNRPLGRWSVTGRKASGAQPITTRVTADAPKPRL